MNLQALHIWFYLKMSSAANYGGVLNFVILAVHVLYYIWLDTWTEKAEIIDK